MMSSYLEISDVPMMHVLYIENYIHTGCIIQLNNVWPGARGGHFPLALPLSGQGQRRSRIDRSGQRRVPCVSCVALHKYINSA
ncbi:MAG: hypothetical protein JWM47_4596 [Acidimicrobiales bacterium]|nr:hypothetical protein [Acidimicrobiales bacterium]